MLNHNTTHQTTLSLSVSFYVHAYTCIIHEKKLVYCDPSDILLLFDVLPGLTLLSPNF